MRTYHVDKIDDASSWEESETIQASDDVAALADAKSLVMRKNWDAAEVWCKDSDTFVGQVDHVKKYGKGVRA